MAIKPILFSAPMVQAILEGRKTMTRRVVKKKYSNTDLVMFTNKYGTRLIERQNDAPPDEVVTQPDGSIITRRHLVACRELDAPYRPGNILWVRETFYQYGEWHDSEETDEFGVVKQVKTFVPKEGKPIYFADTLPVKVRLKRGFKGGPGYYKHPAIFMPAFAARIFLRVTEVRMEQLQDISQDDMIHEGAWMGCVDCLKHGGCFLPNVCNLVRTAFCKLWDSINSKRAKGIYAWDRNPWVWAVGFKRVDKPESWPG